MKQMNRKQIYQPPKSIVKKSQMISVHLGIYFIPLVELNCIQMSSANKNILVFFWPNKINDFHNDITDILGVEIHMQYNKITVNNSSSVILFYNHIAKHCKECNE